MTTPPPVLYAFGCARCGYATVPVTIDATPYHCCPACGGDWVKDPPARPGAVAPQVVIGAAGKGEVDQHSGGFWQ